jgi:hypothetical protein
MANFNPREHLITIKNRQGAADYLPVQFRLVWFRTECPQGTIETEIVHLDLDKDTEEETSVWNAEKRRSEKVIKTAKGMAIFRATVKDGKGGVATSTKMEKAASFPDWLEKAETGAIGRALAALGYGTQFAPELDEEHRIVDSPVDRTPASQPQTTGTNTARSATAGPRNNPTPPPNPEPAPVDIDPSVPTARGLFAKGKERGLWAGAASFFDFATTELGVAVDSNTKLTPEQRATINVAIEKAEPVEVVEQTA